MLKMMIIDNTVRLSWQTICGRVKWLLLLLVPHKVQQLKRDMIEQENFRSNLAVQNSPKSPSL